MTDAELPTYLTRSITLTKAQLQTSLGNELLSLCRSVTADGRLAPEELTSLRRWLDDATAADMPALQHLRRVIGRVLADGRITPEEYEEVYRAVEAVLPFEDRKRAFAARQRVESDEAIRRPTGANGARVGWIMVVIGLAAAAIVWLATA